MQGSSTPLIEVRFLYAGPYISAIGEMDIISVFETEGKGSIPLEPAKQKYFKKVLTSHW